MTLLWLALAGGLGTLARYGLGEWIKNCCGQHFPWGTLAVNVLGCFLFGLVWSFTEDRLLIGRDTRTILLTGFMGGFTTYSSFAFETGEFLRDALWLLAGANIAAQLLLGLLGLFLGLALGRMF